MEKLKKASRFLLSFMLSMIALVAGASSGVYMAAASDLPDAGKVNAGADGTGDTDGIATETQGREDGDPNFYMQDFDNTFYKFDLWVLPSVLF